MKNKKESGIAGIVLLIGILAISVFACFIYYKDGENKQDQEDVLNLKNASANFARYKDDRAISDSFLENLIIKNTLSYNEYGVVFFKETFVYRGGSSDYLIMNYNIPKNVIYDSNFKKKFQENLFAMRRELNKTRDKVDFNKILELQEDFDKIVSSSQTIIPLTSITQPHMLKFYTFK